MAVQYYLNGDYNKIKHEDDTDKIYDNLGDISGEPDLMLKQS